MNKVMSMTGFASVTGTLGEEQDSLPSCTLTIKSTNHRHLDMTLRLPQGFDSLEPLLRKTVKAAVRRGHVELTLVFERQALRPALELDETLLDAYLAAFRRAKMRSGLAQEPDLNALLRLPGMLSNAMVQAPVAAMQEAILAAVEQLLKQFNDAREAEGAALADDLRRGMGSLMRLTVEARELRESLSKAELARLRGRMAELLAGMDDVSEESLAAEAALLVARGDVEEELVRLRTHLDRFVELLDAGGEVGRPLDFLLQEINREANTLLSKTSGSGAGLRLTDVGLEMKVGLERAREQVQNLE